MDTMLERDRLRDFIDLILDSLDEDIDGSGMAARGYLSRYHFDQLVSSAIRESPGAFRRTVAVFAFRELGADDIGIGDPIEWECSLG